MELLSERNVQTLRRVLLAFNYLAVIFYSSIFLFCTKYISMNGYSLSFLRQVNAMPPSAALNFFKVVGLFSVLAFLITIRTSDRLTSGNLLALAEIILAGMITLFLNGSYNGLVLLLISDFIYNRKQLKLWGGYTALSILMLLFMNYDLLSGFWLIPSMDAYLIYLPEAAKSAINFMNNVIGSLNICIFISFLIIYLLVQQQERAKVQSELEFVSQVNQQLKDFTALSHLDIEDNERKRISREIHDTLGHALTGIAAGIDACITLIDINPGMARDQLVVLSKVVRDGIQDVRRSLRKMRPGVLENRSLKEGVEEMLKEFEEVSHITVGFYYEWDDIDLDKAKEDIVYRIIQESVTNAVRHGQATSVEVEMFKDDNNKYMICIQDNGIGCEEITEGYGLKQMKERVAILNGVLQFVSEKGKGFRTIVEIHQ